MPTYNRADLLPSALQSIKENLDPEYPVEVVICDNASSDNTKAIIEDFKNKIPGLQYHRNSSNIGPVNNLYKAIDLACGEFIWIFSDDDVMPQGALAYLLGFLKNHPDVFYIYYTRKLVDKNLTPTESPIQPDNLEKDAVYPDGNSLFCSCDGQMPFVIGFYSSTVIKKEIWSDNLKTVKQATEYHAWDHLLIIMKAIRDKKCAIISKVGVLARLNYRPIKTRSKVGFDDSIQCFLEAIKLGYSPHQCLKTIKSIVRSDSRGFVVDKAMGYRHDTILSFLLKNNLGRMLVYSLPWLLFSMLPYKILNMLWKMYCLVNVKEMYTES